MFQTIRPTFFLRSSDTGSLSNVASPTAAKARLTGTLK